MTTERGPMFNGEAARAAQDMCDALEEGVSRRGELMLRTELHTVLRHPTGRYESGITAEPDGADWQINDGGIVYGPWLEGVGSRNKTTRFKGYATFRRVGQRLQATALDLQEGVVALYTSRMGGH